jgi:hypothetical protein
MYDHRSWGPDQRHVVTYASSFEAMPDSRSQRSLDPNGRGQSELAAVCPSGVLNRFIHLSTSRAANTCFQVGQVSHNLSVSKRMGYETDPSQETATEARS